MFSIIVTYCIGITHMISLVFVQSLHCPHLTLLGLGYITPNLQAEEPYVVSHRQTNTQIYVFLGKGSLVKRVVKRVGAVFRVPCLSRILSKAAGLARA